MVMTYTELAGLPDRGECCVLLLPSADSAVHAGLGAELRLRRGFHVFCVPDGPKTAELRKEFLRVLRSPVSHLLVDATPLPPQKGSELFLSLADDLRKRKVRSWWLLPDSLLEHRSAHAVKGLADAFAVVRHDGVIHFLSAPKVVLPEFFAPRPLVRDAAAAPPPSPFESALADLPAAVAVFDARGVPLFANGRAAEEFGLDLSVLSQRAPASLVAKDSVRQLLRCMASLRSTGAAEVSLTLLDRHRRRRPVDLRARRTPDGRTVCMARESDTWVEGLENSAELLSSLLDQGSAVQAMFRGVRLFRAGKKFAELVDWLGLPAEFDMNSLLGKRGVELRKVLADAGTATADIVLVNREGEERRFEFAASLAGTGRQAITHVTLHDVTAREKALRRLEESEGLARELASATAAGLVVVRDGKCFSANRAALEMLGFGTAAELTEKEFAEVCGPRYREQVRQALAGDAAEQTLEIRMLQKGGGSLAVDLRVRPVTVGHACILHDVTPLRKLKTDLRRAHQQQEILEPFMRAFAGSLDPAQIADSAMESLKRDLKFEAGGLLLFRGGRTALAASYGLSENTAAVLAGQAPGEGVPGYLARTLEPVVTTVASYPAFLPLKPQWEAEGFSAVVYAPISSGGTLHGLLVMLGKQQEVDEDWPWLFGSIGVFLGEALAIAYAFVELREQEKMYRGIVGGLPDISYRCMANGALEVMSPRMEQLFGHRVADLVRDPEFWRTLVHPDDRATYSRRIAVQHSGSDSVELYYRMLPRGKAVYRWVRDTVRFERGADGTVGAIVGILTLVAAPPAESAPSGSLPQAARTAQGPGVHYQEDEFASIVSHDLKESLITIEAYSRIVRDEAQLQPEMAEHLDRVVAASGRLKNLIDDLATLSRVGRDAGAHQTFPLQKVFAELLEEFEPTLRLRNARITVQAEAPVVAYDRTQLTMVLRNLVSNGLKFNRSPEPAVEITVQESGGEVTVGVRDNGIGIAAEDRERVFVIFRRLHPSSEFPGTGAGLAIVKRIVERHGGRIWVESGQGSTFYFTIPSGRSGS